MSKCRKCRRHGLFLMVNIKTGLCANCQREIMQKETEPLNPEPQKPVEKSIEIPTVYIGNHMKSKLVEKFEDVELQRPDSMPNFSKIDCCDNVCFCN